MTISADIFGGIDGTGPTDDYEFAAEFEDSFVHKLYKSWPSPAKTYDRGPAASGLTTAMRGWEMWRKVSTNLRAVKATQSRTGSKEPRIFLAGYSRGGAAIIHTCQLLQERDNVKVHCLMLFDAVDRTNTLTDVQTVIPSNVRYCFHAVRSRLSQSREVFGNCGVGPSGHASSVDYKEQYFRCTHGAMGGLGWKKVDADGFIHEEHSDLATAEGVLGLVFQPARTLLGHHVKSKSSISATRITLKMEKDGQASVDNWMSTNLAFARYRVDEQIATMRGHGPGGALQMPVSGG